MVTQQAQPSILPIGPTARQLRVPVAWLRAEAEAGRVPCLRAGKVFLFNLAALELVLAERAAARGEAAQVAGDSSK